jgi:hypothetical protein
MCIPSEDKGRKSTKKLFLNGDIQFRFALCSVSGSLGV